MTLPIRLRPLPEPDGRSVRFQVEFPALSDAPGDEPAPLCAPARLDTGDGHSLDLGVLCAPTAVTWREGRSRDLATYTYDSLPPYAAKLHWGDAVVSAAIDSGEQAEDTRPSRLDLPLVALQNVPDTMQVAVNLRVTGLAGQQQLRVDGGSGLVRWLDGKDGADQSADWTLDYAKAGHHRVAVDLLDAEGFWLATLAQSPLEVSFQVEEPLVYEEPAEEIGRASCRERV